MIIKTITATVVAFAVCASLGVAVGPAQAGEGHRASFFGGLAVGALIAGAIVAHEEHAYAERLYEERLGDTRATIGAALGVFTIAIERQKPDEIEHARKKLTDLLDEFDRGFFL